MERLNNDPQKCNCNKGDWCPLWQHGDPDPDARVQRDRRVATYYEGLRKANESAAWWEKYLNG